MSIRATLCCSTMVCLAACAPRPSDATAMAPAPASASPSTTDLEELSALARLYGHVRFFHPSDEAATADWNTLAVHAVQRVTQATNRDELAAALEEVFHPFAPTLDVYAQGQHPRDAAGLFPASTQGLDVVAWQHLGFGFGDMRSVYASKRTHRPREMPRGHQPVATLEQVVDATALAGKAVRLRAWAQVDPERLQANVRLQLQAMADSGPLRAGSDAYLSPRWAELMAELTVPPDAEAVSIGVAVAGPGAAWVDDFVLEVREGNAWTPVPIDNGDFETDALASWKFGPANFHHQIVPTAHGGKGGLWIARRIDSLTDDLFEERPQGGELMDESLGAGLRFQLPLSLYGRDAQIVNGVDVGAPPPLPDLLGTPREADDPAVRLAAVIVAWSVFEHFYPYFVDIDVDWSAQLQASLTDALDDESPADTHRTLQRLVAALVDGHGSVRPPFARTDVFVPARFDVVEGQVVVMSTIEGSGVQVGDVVLTIDGVDVQARLQERMALVSGTPQWRTFRALGWSQITAAAPGTKARLEIVRAGTPMTLTVDRRDARVPAPFEREPIGELENGIWYVDLGKAAWTDIAAKIDVLASAPGVVFDLRGYPNGTHPILAHLLTVADSDEWMFTAKKIRPGVVEGWEGAGWHLQPAQPHISGKVAFITGGGAISYAESVMGYVEGYQLGEIVGGHTAGATGNINPFTTPGGYTITSTGMRVTKHDGTRHHGVGVTPTIEAAPTVAGVLAGRDELLERAVAAVRGE